MLSKGWVNIESEDGLQARIAVAERRIESRDVEFDEIEGNSSTCEQWNLHVIWLSSQTVMFKYAGKELLTPPIMETNG